MQKGLKKINGELYYFSPTSSAVHYGFLDINGKTYYFGENGAAVSGCRVIDNKTYIFDENSKALQTGFLLLMEKRTMEQNMVC